MMRVNIKNIVEIATGITIGVLASEAVDKVVELTKEAVVKIKDKKGA